MDAPNPDEAFWKPPGKEGTYACAPVQTVAQYRASIAYTYSFRIRAARLKANHRTFVTKLELYNTRCKETFDIIMKAVKEEGIANEYRFMNVKAFALEEVTPSTIDYREMCLQNGTRYLAQRRKFSLMLERLADRLERESPNRSALNLEDRYHIPVSSCGGFKGGKAMTWMDLMQYHYTLGQYGPAS
ncbi:hypothetical protein BJ508DRAFT_313569 [Ascobolus immersus RN42]|uniref:Uncharacterized protein n=1 Tax=Ascobolus immersus RN42 TaxID=1160509 RepID=A0A3N4HPG0_ASCIM|nr:hypothetical protein BJ508DRAFT_313569 [Ascobolus immersus RN42]